MSNKLVKCKYPRIIRHPLLWQFILNGYDIFVDSRGRSYKFSQQDKDKFAYQEKVFHPLLNIQIGYELNEPHLYPNLSPILERKPNNFQSIKHLYHPIYNLSEEEAVSCSLLNSLTGDVKPVFIVVKCNNCSLCIDAKKSVITSRLILESLRHNENPFFVRLSFDQEHYPKNVEDLKEHTRPIQLFHKRLRKYFSKAGMNTDFKYFVTSEYGGKLGRLHYHCLYYGLHNLNYVPIPNQYEDKHRLPMIYRFTDILRKTWQNGFVQVEIARDLTGRYAMKYMQKDYQHKTKQLKSIHLGKAEVDKNAEFLRQHPDVTNFKIVTKDGQIMNIPIYGYIANWVYPNVNRQVPKEIRDVFYRVSNFVNNHLNDNALDYIDYSEAEIVKSKFNEFFKLFGYENIATPIDYRNYGYLQFQEDVCYLDNLDLDLEKIYYLDYQRQQHTNFILMHNFGGYDVPYEVAKLNVKISNLLNKERDEE